MDDLQKFKQSFTEEQIKMIHTCRETVDNTITNLVEQLGVDIVDTLSVVTAILMVPLALTLCKLPEATPAIQHELKVLVDLFVERSKVVHTH